MGKVVEIDPWTPPSGDSASEHGSETVAASEQQGPRLFTRLMKDACWRRARLVPGRDAERWRYDTAGNVVCRALTGCAGPLCHEYDHIEAYARGGTTSVENCQILQTRVNRYKRDQDASQEQMRAYSVKFAFSSEELDMLEMAIYGDLRRSVPGPLPGFVESTTFECRCKSAIEFQETMKQLEGTTAFPANKIPSRAVKHAQTKHCMRPAYENSSPIPPPPQYPPSLGRV